MRFLTLAAALLAAAAPPAAAADKETLTRLVFQDHAASAVRWADVYLHEGGQVTLGKVNDVAGFKKMDPEKQRLVQMQRVGAFVLCGVRDEEDGAAESGWVLIHTGARHSDHGDHAHWSYKTRPAVLDQRLDAAQGNPAHVYVYDKVFYVANDRLDGYTRIDPGAYRRDPGGKHALGTPAFHKGGGNHITLAVAGGKVGYSCWVDGGGPNKGRVDVTPVSAQGGGPAYTFRLPVGGLHGATANQGRVFLAPADGVYVLDADAGLGLSPEQVKPHHVSLGKDGDKPRRTGSFVNHGPYVLCTTGRGESAALALLDARQPRPEPVFVPLALAEGTRAVTPAVVTTRKKQSYALVFADAEAGEKVADALHVLDLDPNRDGDCRDARVIKTIAIGKSKVQGHFGHHAVAFTDDGTWAFFTNPGDATVSALALADLEVKATFPVGGTPTTILAHGAAEGRD